MSYKIYVRSKNRDMEVHYALVVYNEMHTFLDIAWSFKTKKFFLSHCHFQLPVDHPQWLNANQSCVWKLKTANSLLVKNRWESKICYGEKDNSIRSLIFRAETRGRLEKTQRLQYFRTRSAVLFCGSEKVVDQVVRWNDPRVEPPRANHHSHPDCPHHCGRRGCGLLTLVAVPQTTTTPKFTLVC